MIRLLIWQVGTWFFIAALWRTGYWREILPLVVLAASAAWIVGGGLWVSYRGKARRDISGATPADHAAVREMLLRAVEERKKQEAAK